MHQINSRRCEIVQLETGYSNPSVISPTSCDYPTQGVIFQQRKVTNPKWTRPPNCFTPIFILLVSFLKNITDPLPLPTQLPLQVDRGQ